MRNKILLFIVVILSIVYVYLRSSKNNATSFLKEEKTSIVDIEDYVVGVLAGEMPASFEYEALKAQAIASRTIGYYKLQNEGVNYDLKTDANLQHYISIEQMKEKWQDKFDYYYNIVLNAAKDTKYLVMYYNGEIISSYYFSMSNGKTENIQNVFGEAKDYLVSVDSGENSDINNYKVDIILDINEVINTLGITSFVINDIKENETGRVSEIVIDNQIFTGVQIRKLLNLRSTDFEITSDDKNVYITTYGYGHGVGMSQYGANVLAKQGYDYKQILKHYYTGIEIKSIK